MERIDPLRERKKTKPFFQRWRGRAVCPEKGKRGGTGRKKNFFINNLEGEGHPSSPAREEKRKKKHWKEKQK